MDKNQTRKDMLKMRRSMAYQQVKCNSDKIKNTLINMDIIKSSKTIMLYLSFGNEVDTFELLDWCLENGKNVVVPYCIEENNKMVPCKITSRNDLERSPLGFLQPKEELIDDITYDIDVVIVPGVAFDIKGNRIGFGGGYYDRFLSSHSKVTTIALCHDYQLIKEVQKDKFDIPMNNIVTEKKKVTII
ncbi:5-formyltetrahydrofolate cyclo-ligase [Clostridiaceae bacterium M8S5]|nr:5-formyltetrahydrofolate cyclo-ligase [Clostridiaceae bacterium M8S5]